MQYSRAFWRRIETVIRRSGMGCDAFARHIGMLDAPNLLWIRDDRYRVSYDLAHRIHSKFPRYSIQWLLTGRNKP